MFKAGCGYEALIKDVQLHRNVSENVQNWVRIRSSVADLEGVQGVRSNPPLGPNYSIFMGNFKTFCIK